MPWAREGENGTLHKCGTLKGLAALGSTHRFHCVSLGSASRVRVSDPLTVSQLTRDSTLLRGRERLFPIRAVEGSGDRHNPFGLIRCGFFLASAGYTAFPSFCEARGVFGRNDIFGAKR